MMQYIRVLTVFFATVFSFCLHADPPDAVPDGGFENPKWLWNYATPQRFEKDLKDAHSGKYSLRLFARKRGEVSQLFSNFIPLSADAGEPCKIEVSFFVKGPCLFHIGYFEKIRGKYVQQKNVLGKPASSTFRANGDRGKWTEFKKILEIPVRHLRNNPALRLHFQCWGEDGKNEVEVKLDDVSLKILSGTPKKGGPEKAKERRMPNLVFNPGFENGVWEYAGSFGKAKGRAERVTDQAKTGKYSFLLSNEGPGGGTQIYGRSIYLPVGREKDCKLRISFWSKGDGVQLRLHILGNDSQGKSAGVRKTDGRAFLITETQKPSEEWSVFSKDITIPKQYLLENPGVKIQFMRWSGKNPVKVYLDDISIRILDCAPLPPPKPAKLELIPPPTHANNAKPLPALPYKFGLRDGYLTRNGKPFFFTGNYTIGGGQWGIQTLWMLKLLNYSMLTVDWSGNTQLTRDPKGNWTIRWKESESAASVLREIARAGVIMEFDNGNYMPSSKGTFMKMAKELPEMAEVYTMPSHFYSFDHNTELGRKIHYNDWLSRFRYIGAHPLMAFECWNELGYRPNHERVLKGFREYAKKKYGSLTEANKIWRKNFKSWNEVMPPHLSKDILEGAQAHQMRLAMREKYFEMYYDFFRFVQLDFIPGFKKMKSHFRTFSDAPWSVDWRGHRHYSDGYAALDLDLLEDVIDINLLHTWITAFDYRNNPADAPSVLNSISTGLMFHNFLRTNSKHPIINPEDILLNVATPGSDLRIMAENCFGKFPQKWIFRWEPNAETGLEKGYFKSAFNDSDWDRMAVPGCWDETEKYKGRRGFGWYRAKFNIPGKFRQDYLDGSEKFYIFGKGVAQKGTFWINGVKVGTSSGWATNYRIDIGAYLKYGEENTLAVMVEGSGYSNGLRFYIHILPGKGIGKSRPYVEKEYASRLWTYLTQGESAVTLWNWEDIWRPFMPRVIAEIANAAEIVMPETRKKYDREAGFLMPYLYFRGLPVSMEKYFIDYMNYFGAGVFHRIPEAVYSEKNILQVTPERTKVIFYPYARIVHKQTFEHMKKYVESGGVAVVTFDSLKKDFSRYTDTGIDEFANIRTAGDRKGETVVKIAGKSFTLPQGDMTGKTGVDIIPGPGAEQIASYNDGKPAIVRTKRGKGNIVYVAANLNFEAAHALAGILFKGLNLPETIKLTETGDKSEFPYLEGRFFGNMERFLLYLHNWGGKKRKVTVMIPDELVKKGSKYLIRDIRNISVPAQILQGDRLKTWTFEIDSMSPSAILFESGKPMKLRSVSKKRADLIRKITESDKNPDAMKQGVKKALFMAPISRERLGRVVYPQVTECLKHAGIEVWQLPLAEWTKETLAKFDMVFLGEGHIDGIRPFEKTNHPIYEALTGYLRNGGSLMVVGGSAAGSNINGRNQINNTFAHKLGFDFSSWNLDSYAKNPESCGYGDAMQVLATDFSTMHPAAKHVKKIQFFTQPTYKTKKNSGIVPLVLTGKNDVNSGRALVIGGTVGKGKAIFAGDSLWLQPFRVEKADNLQFLMNCLNYLAGKEIRKYSEKELSSMLLITEKELLEAEKEEGF